MRGSARREPIFGLPQPFILAILCLLETIVLGYAWAPPLGWKAELRSLPSSGFRRPNLMDPATRLMATEGRQTVDAEGHVIECAAHRGEGLCAP